MPYSLDKETHIAYAFSAARGNNDLLLKVLLGFDRQLTEIMRQEKNLFDIHTELLNVQRKGEIYARQFSVVQEFNQSNSQNSIHFLQSNLNKILEQLHDDLSDGYKEILDSRVYGYTADGELVALNGVSSDGYKILLREDQERLDKLLKKNYIVVDEDTDLYVLESKLCRKSNGCKGKVESLFNFHSQKISQYYKVKELKEKILNEQKASVKALLQNYHKLPALYQRNYEDSPSETEQELLNASVPLDVVDVDGNTLLHTAVAHGSYQVVHLLLNRGASKDICNKHNQTPVDYAGISEEEFRLNLQEVAHLKNERTPFQKSILEFLEKYEETLKSMENVFFRKIFWSDKFLQDKRTVLNSVRQSCLDGISDEKIIVQIRNFHKAAKANKLLGVLISSELYAGLLTKAREYEAAQTKVYPGINAFKNEVLSELNRLRQPNDPTQNSVESSQGDGKEEIKEPSAENTLHITQNDNPNQVPMGLESGQSHSGMEKVSAENQNNTHNGNKKASITNVISFGLFKKNKSVEAGHKTTNETQFKSH